VSRRSRRRLDVAVTTLGAALEGVTEAEGRDVRIRGALPGEELTVEVVRRHRGRWHARPVEWQRRSAARAEPVCSAFHECGGCAAQHVAGADQLAWKQEQLLTLLESAGLQPRRLRAPVPGPRYYYRRKARLGVRHLADKQEVLVGFREAFGSRIARVGGCPVLVRPLAELLPALAALVNRLSVRHAVPQLEVAAGDDRKVVIVRHLESLTDSDRLELARFEAEQGIDVLLQSAGYESITTLQGAPPRLLHYRLDEFGVALAFGPADFVQVNARVNERLVRAAVSGLALRPADRVLDLFCGIGNFTLPIARSGTRITGLEASPALVARARHNARCNGLDALATFEVVDLYQCDAAAIGQGFDKVLLDPPRSGIGSALELLSGPRVERVVYVSCHAGSFVKDARALVGAGYAFSEVGLFDMFPHTAHVETMGVFCRR
jgi:23S rRNA (uracil1939-C5)-methyltransferase